MQKDDIPPAGIPPALKLALILYFWILICFKITDLKIYYKLQLTATFN
jgi:hypothetical protein